jgi:hypothetical protein
MRTRLSIRARTAPLVARTAWLSCGEPSDGAAPTLDFIARVSRELSLVRRGAAPGSPLGIA